MRQREQCVAASLRGVPGRQKIWEGCFITKFADGVHPFTLDFNRRICQKGTESGQRGGSANLNDGGLSSHTYGTFRPARECRQFGYGIGGLQLAERSRCFAPRFR